MKGRLISVGILSAEEVNFTLLEEHLCRGESFKGACKALYFPENGGCISFCGKLYDELVFTPSHPCGDERFAPPSFALEGVTIGVGFHWQRSERQTFAGSLKIIACEGRLTAIDIIGIEDYLRSVISSEMKATASPEFLKAHAVISRSWLLAQIERRATLERGRPDFVESDTMLVRWADREDHSHFDVCADDHCQRYQGLTRAGLFSKPGGSAVENAVASTCGEVLSYEGRICDARFSKCCGGRSETFDTCWEDASYPYLTPVEDPFCNTSDEAALSQVLNDYDLETKDFYQWSVSYDPAELASLIKRRSGIDFGERIVALEPLKRGASGRISLLRIRGTAREMTVGKELTIRKWLSDSHLKSSAFEVSYTGGRFVLSGRGWGHGVGLCQIGAAVMGSRGYSYRDILHHYFPAASLSNLEELPKQ